MIQLLTNVNIIDNSGGSKGRCIKILEPHGRDYAKVGDIILVSIKETIKLSSSKALFTQGGRSKGASLKTKGDSNKLTKGTLHKALVVRTKKSYSSSITFSKHKLDNFGYCNADFDDNAVILLKSNLSNKKILDLVPLGTRIKGPISNTLTLINKDNKYQKILSLSKLHY